MMAGTSSGSSTSGVQPNSVRPETAAGPASPGSVGTGGAGDLDDIDRHIVREMARDARIANNALAERVGIAPSTCLGRVRSLRERGVIRGYHADVDPAALGRPLQAMIAVRLQSHARSRIRGFVAEVAGLPEVLDVVAARVRRDAVLQRGRVLHRDVADLRAHPRRRGGLAAAARWGPRVRTTP